MIDAYIAVAIGDDLAKTIASHALLPSEEIHARFKALLPHDASGIGGIQPASYWYKEVGYFTRVQSFAESGTLDGDDRASMLAVRRGEHTLGFRAPWRLVIATVRAVLAAPKRDGRSYKIAATSDDGAFGFIFTSHGGYVRREFHDDETVYKVSRWHPLAE